MTNRQPREPNRRTRAFGRPLATGVVAALLLVACGGDGGDEITATRSYEMPLHIEDDADEYRYVADGQVPDFTVGDEVTFVVDNTGTLPHDLRVVGPDGTTLGTAPAVAPGGTIELTVLLTRAGVHQLNCVVDDHLLVHGMQSFIEVTEA